MPGGRPPTPVAVRLWARIDASQPEDECWLWPGSLNAYGYGKIAEGPRLSRAQRQAHIVAYESVYGPVPDGLHIDHTCHGADLDCPGGLACLHRRCVNPVHLEAVTQAENNRRMQARKTHCPKKHSLSGTNLYRAPSSGHRECRACREANRRRWYADKGLQYHRDWRARRKAKRPGETSRVPPMLHSAELGLVLTGGHYDAIAAADGWPYSGHLPEDCPGPDECEFWPYLDRAKRTVVKLRLGISE